MSIRPILFDNYPLYPGNCLLCAQEDGTPQLGLIDYGQVKKLSKEKRHLFSKIIIALDDDNREDIIRLMKEAGFKSQKMDPEVIYLYAKVGYDEDNLHLTKGKHIQLFMEELQNRDPIIELPTDFIMIGRASLILRGLAHALHQGRSVAAVWRPIAERVLKEDI
jgi:predicted unusual protein kinase regulating ubiquinone biosynthesis (AarF/ABC1/UbiB family)